MNFTDPIFLFLFLPLLLCFYWLCVPKLRVLVILAASLFFYAWSDVRYVIVLCVAMGINYLLTLRMDTCQHPFLRRTALFGIITVNLAILLSFKYPEITQQLATKGGINLAFFHPLHLPLGISFFTFQAIAFAVDVYHRKHVPELNPLKFSIFMSLFPKIGAGPIIRFEEVDKALSCPTVTVDECAYGAKRFIIGMGKKLIIADTLAKAADQIFSLTSGDLTAPVAWLGIICYTLQLYYDFSGYSDMAIGLGRMLGFSFRENFDYPYISRSLTEFWRRWHLSLSTWFRDYLYMPLLYSLMTDKVRQKIALGLYKTNYRSLFCIIVVFTLCGWWHGSTWNFVIWGLLHGLILASESWKLSKFLKKAPVFISHTYTLLVIMFCWVFFRSSTFGEALLFVKAMLGLGVGTNIVYSVPLYLNFELQLVLVMAMIGAMPITRFARSRLANNLPAALNSSFFVAMETGAVAIVLLLSLLKVGNATSNSFLYFRF